MLKAPTNQRRDHLLEVFGAIRTGNIHPCCYEYHACSPQRVLVFIKLV